MTEIGCRGKSFQRCLFGKSLLGFELGSFHVDQDGIKFRSFYFILFFFNCLAFKLIEMLLPLSLVLGLKVCATIPGKVPDLFCLFLTVWIKSVCYSLWFQKGRTLQTDGFSCVYVKRLVFLFFETVSLCSSELHWDPPALPPECCI